MSAKTHKEFAKFIMDLLFDKDVYDFRVDNYTKQTVYLHWKRHSEPKSKYGVKLSKHKKDLVDHTDGDREVGGK